MGELFHKLGGGTIIEIDQSGASDMIEFFERIAREEGWQPGEQLRQQPETARHLGVTVQNKLVGGVQVVLPTDDNKLPYSAVWPDIQMNPAKRAAEVTVLAIDKAFRGRAGIFWPLCTELWRLCVREQIGTLVLEATPEMFDKYCRAGWPLEIVGDLRMHWGENCYLCIMSVQAVAGSLLQLALKSPTYRVLIDQAIRPGCNRRCGEAVALA